MKGYQRAFGVHDWDRISDKESKTVESNLPAAQSKRIQLVRNRCNSQNQALSSWWKLAIQANVQQRMWMQLGHNIETPMLPPRFERIYQPSKIAQFDRFFGNVFIHFVSLVFIYDKLTMTLDIARSWATPVRRLHAAQHGDGGDDEIDFTEFRRNVTGRPVEGSKRNKEAEESKDMESSLEKMINDYGFAPTGEITLKSFVELQTESNRQFDSLGIETAGTKSYDNNC